MQLELVEHRARPDDLPLAVQALQNLIVELGKPDWLVNLVLVDDLQMADLNQRWYGGHGPTDVLSFSYLEAAGRGRPTCRPAAGRGA